MAKNRQFQTQKEPQVNQETQEQTSQEQPMQEQAAVDQTSQTVADQESVVQEQAAVDQTSQTVADQESVVQEQAAQEQAVQEPQKSEEQTNQEQEKPIEAAQPVQQVKQSQPVVQQPQAQATQETTAIANEVTVPEDIKAEVKEDFFKFLKHFSESATDSDKAWARNALTTAVKYKRKRPLDTKGCLEATMFTLGLMTSAIQYPESAQQRMRFVFACFKWCDCIFDLELTGRGANQLTAQQYKQYTALSSLFHYWADLGSGAQINKRFNVAKEMGNVFDPILAQRVVSIVGA